MTEDTQPVASAPEDTRTFKFASAGQGTVTAPVTAPVPPTPASEE